MSCFAVDINNDGKIDIIDMQRIASRFGFNYGSSFYDVRYDFEPWQTAPDGAIDIKEVQLVFGRFGGRCAIAKSGANEMHHSNGTYYGSVTVAGFTTSSIPPALRPFDLNAGRTRGEEVCVGTDAQLDWDYFGQLYPQPIQTVAGSGGYATGFTDCLLGHSLWVDNWYWWQNAQFPTIPSEIQPSPSPWLDSGYTHCAELLAVQGGGDPLHLCSAFPE